MRRFLLPATLGACLVLPQLASPLYAEDDAARLRRQDEETRRNLTDTLKAEERARDQQARAWADQVKQHQEGLRRLKEAADDAEQRRRAAVRHAQEEEKRHLEQQRPEDAARQRAEILKQEAERQAVARKGGEDYARQSTQFAEQDTTAAKRLDSEWRQQIQALERQARELESRGLREAARVLHEAGRKVEDDVRQQARRQSETEQWYKTTAQHIDEERRRGEAQWRQSLAEHDEKAARKAADRQRDAADAEARARTTAAEAEAQIARDRQEEDRRRAEDIRRLQDEQRQLHARNRADEAHRLQREVERRDAERRDARNQDLDAELERLRKQVDDGKAAWSRDGDRLRQDIRRKQDEVDWLDKLGLRDAAKVARDEVRRLEDALRAAEDRQRSEGRQWEDAIARLETVRRTPEPPLVAVTGPTAGPAAGAPVGPPPAPAAAGSWCGGAAPCDEALAATAFLGVCLFAQPAAPHPQRETVPCPAGQGGATQLPLTIRWGSDNSLRLSSGLTMRFDGRRGSARFSDGQTARVDGATVSFSNGLTGRLQDRTLRYSNGAALAWDSRGRLRWSGLAAGPVTVWLEKGGAVAGTGPTGPAGWPCSGRAGDPSLCPKVLAEMGLLAGGSFASGAGLCSREITRHRVPGFRPMKHAAPAGDRLNLDGGLTAQRTGATEAMCSNGVSATGRDGGVVFSSGVTARLEGRGHVVLSNGLRVTVDADGRAYVSE